MHRLLALAVVVVLLATACGSSDDSSTDTAAGGDDAAVADPTAGPGDAAEPDPVDDTPEPEPIEPDPEPVDDTPMPVEPDPDDEAGGDIDEGPQPGDGIGVAELLERSIAGPVTVEGFLIVSDGVPRLCAAIAESFPPQCGGPSAILEELDLDAVDDLRTEGAVSWTDQPLTMIGELVSGVIVVVELIQ
ncbi:MAG: hypothetical protein OEU32_10675 [Acidimicrobiia bacterium]|nr:hypothetical protein [Acidimicrobiia bacterium]